MKRKPAGREDAIASLWRAKQTPDYRSEILPPPSSKAESFLRSRMHVAFGVLRCSDGVVSSGCVLLSPSQNSLVGTAASGEFLRSHSSAAAAKRDRCGTAFSFACAPSPQPKAILGGRLEREL